MNDQHDDQEHHEAELQVDGPPPFDVQGFDWDCRECIHMGGMIPMVVITHENGKHELTVVLRPPMGGDDGEDKDPA